MSPSWYPSKAEHRKVVPTWNYEAVHLHGTVQIESIEGKRKLSQNRSDGSTARRAELTASIADATYEPAPQPVDTEEQVRHDSKGSVAWQQR